MKFQCQLCGYLDAKAPRVCPRCSLKAGADPDQHPEIVEAWKKARAAKPMTAAEARSECLYWARLSEVPLAEAERFADEYVRIAMEPVPGAIDPTKQISD